VAESAVVRRWLRSTLLGDATLVNLIGQRAYNGVAQAGATFPYVVYNYQAGAGDVMVVGGGRVWTDQLWQIRAVAEGTSTTTIEPVVDRIDTLLHDTSGTAQGGVVCDCIRENQTERVEVTDGKTYVNLSALYRVKVQRA
jgi:hypothetical protein